MPYVKITGYLEIDDNDLDPTSFTGLTTKAYEEYTITRPAAIADLEDVDVEPDDRP